ncbi:hypothetical protein K4A83_17710 [Spirulina subsalsa FACHB-351]|uniref:Uncharacterized protein n=1 Tax=Spirulina subsalsa FACHB-351 TaxID=234711 RepID=A0ABT3L9A8_9CYAN|nr:hypothetical protein [Spirulina subsalsa]MCW6038093.1 hypothetical protein [Spirulina subsalsa FACHB-351]
MTVLSTAAQGQIVITGGTLIFFENNGTTYNNAPVTGYLETKQGRIESADFNNVPVHSPEAVRQLFGSVPLNGVPVLLQMSGEQPALGNQLSLKASGTAYSPNGPVLFSDVPVQVDVSFVMKITVGTEPFNTNFGTFNARMNGLGQMVEFGVVGSHVTGGTFGASGTFFDNSGNKVSLAPDNFHFDAKHVFPTIPVSNSSTTPSTPTPAPQVSTVAPAAVSPVSTVAPAVVMVDLPQATVTVEQSVQNSELPNSELPNSESLNVPGGAVVGAEAFVEHSPNNRLIPDPVAEGGNNYALGTLTVFSEVPKTPAVPRIVSLIRRDRNPRVSRLVPLTHQNYQNYNLAQ